MAKNQTVTPCGCIDTACPTHPGEACAMPANTNVYRVDMDDADGTPMCFDCCDDAIESGLYRLKEVA